MKIFIGLFFMGLGIFMMFWPFRNKDNNDGWMIISGAGAIFVGMMWFL